MITWKQLVKLPVLPKFYRLIRRLFGVDIAMISADGKDWRILGKGRELNPFCKALQRCPGGWQHCADCDAAHARLATRKRQPIRYTCHAGLTDFVIPIIVEQEVIAHLLCGQVLDRPPTESDWRAVRQRLNWLRGDHRALRHAYRLSIVVSPETQKDLISLLRLFAHYVAVSHARLLMLEQDPQDRVISKAMAFLKDRFRNQVRLDEVAAAAGTSKRSLIRIFYARTGASVLDHLHRFRIEHACQQLRQTHAKIGQVGLDSGFGSIQQFNRVFRKLMCDTPRRWREKVRRTPYDVCGAE